MALYICNWSPIFWSCLYASEASKRVEVSMFHFAYAYCRKTVLFFGMFCKTLMLRICIAIAAYCHQVEINDVLMEAK